LWHFLGTASANPSNRHPHQHASHHHHQQPPPPASQNGSNIAPFDETIRRLPRLISDTQREGDNAPRRRRRGVSRDAVRRYGGVFCFPELDVSVFGRQK